MRTIITPFLALAATVSLAGIRTIELADGTTPITTFTIPSRCAKVIAYETMMIHTNSGEQTTLSLNRTVKTTVPHTDIITTTTTQKVVSVKTLANNYTVAANYYAEEGAMADAQVSTFSNCYASTSKGMNHGDKGTSRITFMPGSGTATTTYPTTYMVRAEFFGNYWYTNFTWNASSTSITVTSPASVHPFYRINVTRPLPPIEILQTNDVAITTATTNHWNEGVSRAISIPLASATTTNGYAYATPASLTYIFPGDSFRVSSPCATNNPGTVRVIIAD